VQLQEFPGRHRPTADADISHKQAQGEVWTWNGPQLDRITLVGGLPDGKAILLQDKSAAQQVPVFRADMTAQDLASMLEVSYRVRGVTVFNLESVEPVDFLGGAGVKLRYSYASGIGFTKKGSCVLRVVGQNLYAMKLEGVANDHFEAVAQEFDRLVGTARLNQVRPRFSTEADSTVR
jgi:hypothetical protein